MAIRLDLQTAAFEKNARGAEKRVSTMERNFSRAGKAIAGAFTVMFGAFAVGQLADLAKKGLDYASSLGEVAAQAGVSARSLQEYRYAASQAGIETGEMDQALAQLSRRLGDAANGAKEPSAALERLGISVRDANGHVRDAGDVIPLIAEALTGIESPAERASVLVDLFGKSGQKLAPLLEGGAAGVNNLRDAAHKLGIVLDDGIIQDADDAADKLSAMKQVMEAKIAGFAGKNAQLIVELADKLFRLAEAGLKAADALAKFASQDGPGRGKAIDENNRIIRASRGDVKTSSSIMGDTFSIGDRGTTRSTGYIDAFGNPYTKQRRIRLPKGGRGGGGGANAMGANAFGGGFGQFDPGQGASGWMRMTQAANDLARPVAEVDRLVENMAVTNAPRLLDAIKKMTPAAMELRGATQGILDRLFPEQAEARQYAEEIAVLNTALKEGQITVETHGQAILALRREYQGFGEAVAAASEIVSQEFGPSLDEISEAISDRLPSDLGKMANDSQVATVRVAQSFADMAESIASSLGNLIGGKAGGILSSLVNIGIQFGRAGGFGSDASSFLNRIPAFANGTSSAPGGMALVGERGPELVNLPRGARVIPNSNLGNMGGGIATIVPSKYFDVVVDGRIVRAAPGIANAGAAEGEGRVRRAGSRRLA